MLDHQPCERKGNNIVSTMRNGVCMKKMAGIPSVPESPPALQAPVQSRGGRATPALGHWASLPGCGLFCAEVAAVPTSLAAAAHSRTHCISVSMQSAHSKNPYPRVAHHSQHSKHVRERAKHSQSKVGFPHGSPCTTIIVSPCGSPLTALTACPSTCTAELTAYPSACTRSVSMQQLFGHT